MIAKLNNPYNSMQKDYFLQFSQKRSYFNNSAYAKFHNIIFSIKHKLSFCYQSLHLHCCSSKGVFVQFSVEIVKK